MDLLDINKISLVRGMVYNPHSQGIVERGHRTIKNALICQYLEKKDEFDLQESVNVVVNRYNNIIHSTTKKKPRDVFFSNDIKLWEEVFKNTLNCSKNFDINKSIFKVNDTVLLFNNFSFKNKTKNIKNIRKIKSKNEEFYVFNLWCCCICNWFRDL